MATNYDNLSDADLDRLVSEKLNKQPVQAAPQKDLNSLSDAELDEMVANKLAGRDIAQFPVSTLGADQGVINEGQPAPRQEQPMGDLGDRAMTQLESFGNTVSLGYLPQIQAAFEKINPDPSGGLDDQLRAQGFTVPEQSYVNLRDENIKRQEAQGARNPYDQAAGMIGGMVASAPVLGAAGRLVNAGSKGASGFARLKDSARIGASLGGVSNPGDIEGVVNPLQSVERLQNTGTGAAIGGAGQAVGEGVAKASEAVKAAPALFDKVGNITAVKAIGAIGKDFKKMFRKGSTSHEIGETLLNKGIVSGGDTVEAIAQKTGSALNETGRKLGAIYKETAQELTDPAKLANMSVKNRKLIELTRIDGEKLSEIALKKMEKNLRNDLARTEIKEKVLSTLTELQSKGKDIDILDVNQMISKLDKRINYDKALRDMPEVQQELKNIRDVLKKARENRVRVMGRVSGDKGKIDELRQLNKEYGHLAKANGIASERAKVIEGHSWLSLSENIQGGTGATIGALTGDSPQERVKNALYGFAAGAAAEKSGKFLTPAIAKSAKRLSVLLKQPANMAKYGEPLIEAAKKSPQEFQALINQFGKDPEFKRLSSGAK